MHIKAKASDIEGKPMKEGTCAPRASFPWSFNCIIMMLKNLVHPYIQSTTVLCDNNPFSVSTDWEKGCCKIKWKLVGLLLTIPEKKFTKTVLVSYNSKPQLSLAMRIQWLNQALATYLSFKHDLLSMFISILFISHTEYYSGNPLKGH